jgi:hypothetical protein
MDSQSPAPLESAARSQRIDRVVGSDAGLRALVARLIEVSRDGLPAMYLAEEGVFVHTVRLGDGGRSQPAGVSPRYSAIVLRGAQWLDEAAQRRIFAGETAGEYCDRLVRSEAALANPGDLALVAWNAATLGHPEAPRLVASAASRFAALPGALTVELAWALAAATAARAEAPARRLRDRLLSAQRDGRGVFAYRVDGRATGPRGHVASFADQVYPIQALARFHSTFADEQALAAADRCAEVICRLQGADGEWWWHYDARSDGVVEGYPVYSVHQDSMAPMALLDLVEAGGCDHSDAIGRGLRWFDAVRVPGRPLIDAEKGAIWRKVARREPGKLVRQLRAASTSLHPGLRLGFLDALFPPGRVDWESRPYHLGWVLDAWLGRL